jgi:uncharacterized alkaline shock family protein YloU
VTLVHESAIGTVTIPDSVLVHIAVRAAESVGSVHVRRKRSVDADARVVRLELTAAPGSRLQVVGRAVQDAVAEALETMCGLAPVAVDLAFEGVE